VPVHGRYVISMLMTSVPSTGAAAYAEPPPWTDYHDDGYHDPPLFRLLLLRQRQASFLGRRFGRKGGSYAATRSRMHTMFFVYATRLMVIVIATTDFELAWKDRSIGIVLSPG
jgi:hypothetical protein